MTNTNTRFIILNGYLFYFRKQILIAQEELNKLIEKFKACGPLFIALGDEVRQTLLLQLANSGFDGINVTNLSSKTKLSRPAISHHLKVLKDSGWVIPVKKGTQIFYRLNLRTNLNTISNVIDEIRTIEQKYSNQAF